MIVDYLKYIIRNFRRRKLRSWLTMIGIFIGIAAVVALISLGQGLQEAINEQFEMMGMDKILITPGGTFFGIGATGIELKEEDKNVVEKVPGVSLVGGFIFKIAKVEFGDEVVYTWVNGLPTDESRRIIEDMQSFKIASGRDLKKADKYKAVIGIMFPEADVFEKTVTTRDKIKIENKEFKVVGTLERIGNPQDDSSIMIPLETSREVLNEPEKFDILFVQVEKSANVGKVADDIKKELRQSRDVEEGEEDFTIQTSEQLMETYQIVFTIVQAVLIGIAAISLLVGGVGIMNTMYTSVLERTREIGIMKAIGARNRDISIIFLMESGLLGLAGGAIGIIIGIGISKLVEIITRSVGITLFKAYFPWYLILGALAFSFIVGSISGLMPARQAALLKPVEALRYE